MAVDGGAAEGSVVWSPQVGSWPTERERQIQESRLVMTGEALSWEPRGFSRFTPAATAWTVPVKNSWGTVNELTLALPPGFRRGYPVDWVLVFKRSSCLDGNQQVVGMAPAALLCAQSESLDTSEIVTRGRELASRLGFGFSVELAPPGMSPVGFSVVGDSFVLRSRSAFARCVFAFSWITLGISLVISVAYTSWMAALWPIVMMLGIYLACLYWFGRFRIIISSEAGRVTYSGLKNHVIALDRLVSIGPGSARRGFPFPVPSWEEGSTIILREVGGREVNVEFFAWGVDTPAVYLGLRNKLRELGWTGEAPDWPLEWNNWPRRGWWTLRTLRRSRKSHQLR